ncbi:MAG: maleylpyruvate isomerase N-terminal domain-containing protein, partial [Spirochaetaceae bacterium]|nr:maleylpyruvate isomerase N-terminal domain-containing protein [Spirochaetaceae bacterium]
TMAYADQDPGTVATELAAAAATSADRFAALSEDRWTRPGRRSNGSVFTVESFARYLVHDLVHHAHDIGTRVG